MTERQRFQLKDADMDACVACQKEVYGKFCGECGSKAVHADVVEVVIGD